MKLNKQTIVISLTIFLVGLALILALVYPSTEAPSPQVAEENAEVLSLANILRKIDEDLLQNNMQAPLTEQFNRIYQVYSSSVEDTGGALMLFSYDGSNDLPYAVGKGAQPGYYLLLQNKNAPNSPPFFLTLEQAVRIDQKIDDGMLNTGSVIGGANPVCLQGMAEKASTSEDVCQFILYVKLNDKIAEGHE